MSAKSSEAKTKEIHLALVGGGTGGHVFPALAVAKELKAARGEARPWLATGRKAAEAAWAAEADMFPVRLFSAPMPYGFRPLGMARTALATAAGAAQAWAWWQRWRPAAVLTFGGYVSAPAALAARMRGIPCVFHAADCLPDRAARMLAKQAALISVNYAEAAEAFEGAKVEVVGQPIRPWLLGASREEAAKALGLEAGRPTVAVMGGSQGARSINYAAINAAAELLERSEAQILHLCGERDYDDLADIIEGEGLPVERYRLMPFLREMQWALALADVAVTRAGANGLAELAAAGVPAIMVPYPHAGGHQRRNAEPLLAAGAGLIVDDDDLDGDRLAGEVLGLVGDRPRREAMGQAARRWARPDAARRLARILLRIAGAES